ncbi:choice-of-anchor D domain-containing protein, partial [Candidatus Poribacteria bacterium]|nr:choice-of-anchor D domain-containing protein [Candidatus Poribacteria bacterium]
VKVGESKQETLAIANPNASDVVVSAITSSRGEFTISPVSFTLNPGGSQTITVTFKPATAGAISATLTIVSNAEAKTVAVSGTGQQQTLSITVDKTSLLFGTVKVGESKQETLTITNPNASDVVVSAITSSRGEFIVAPASFTLNPGSSQTITVTFKPATAGAISAILTITSNALTKIIFAFGTGETIQPIFGTFTEISFANAPPQMIAGGTFQFNIIGTDAAEQTEAVASGDVVWEVSGGVGTVTDNGELTVTTVGKGVVKVTLKANATLIAQTAEITVIAAQAEKVQISMTPDNLTAGSGETATATITVTDEFENPVTGLIITMTATDGNISSTATEAGNGIYNVAYTAGTTIGNVEIRATTPNGKIGTATLTLKEKETTETPTFELTTRDEVMSVDAGEETVSYRLRLDGKNGFSDTIELFASELPPNVTAKIEPKTITLSEAEPIDISDLTLTLPAALAGNDYSFTVFAISGDGKSKVLTLTLKVESAERVSTRLTLTVQPATVAFMETLNLSGDLIPLTNTPIELGNPTITITFIAPSEREHTFETTTDENGNYKLVTPFLPDEVGDWTVISKFVGNDELKLTERESTFTVTKGDAKITFISGETGALGTTIEIVGRLAPGLEDEQIALKILRPDGAASEITSITTETLGVFRHSLELDLAGDWEFTAIWSGNTQYEDETQELVISVTKEIGKAILVLGGGDRNDNPAWESFNGVAEYVHNILLKREFNDEDDIWFLSPDPTRTSGADTQTTQSNLQLAITNWASSRVNRQVPLFLYFLSHNLEDQFLLEKRGNSETFLSASQLAGWLDELPDDTQVTIIIEACHSGNFITAPLLDKNRTIIVSASADRQAKITPSLSSFSKIFFDQINLNKTIAEAFRFTQAKMLVLRTHRSQQPQMDANANGQANQPQDFAVVSSRYIPENIVSLADPPELIKITEATTLGEGISSLRIETELLGVAINRVFATVIPPDFNPDQRFDDWNALAFDEFDLANVGEGKYAATYANFTQPGEYTILVNASNPDGSADPVQTTITVPGGVTSATPWDVDGSGVVDIFDLVIVGRNFGKSGSGDVDGNGLVNIFDLVLVGQHFGERSNQ